LQLKRQTVHNSSDIHDACLSYQIIETFCSG
jgi:hypothetical protein